MRQQELTLYLSKEFDLIFPADDDLLTKKMLIEKINELLLHDFNRLISILYRIDVDETKMKNYLADNSDKDAAIIIAELIIERQLQKIASKNKSRDSSSFDEEERW